MSEVVRSRLESRVDELEDLVRKGLFSTDEIKEIVSARTRFEYKLKRRCSRKEDYLAYINFERELEVTRRQRVQIMNLKSKTTISDYSIVNYILSLYRRAAIKFKGDLNLWLEYVKFAKDVKANKMISKIYASIIQIHPHAINVWIGAANWEFSQNNNPASARILVQRAIRLNRDSKRLWFEYFLLEMKIAAKLLADREILADNPITTEERAKLSVFTGAIPVSVFKFASKECNLTVTEIFEYFKLARQQFPTLPLVSDFVTDFVATGLPDNYKFHVLQAQLVIENLNFHDESFVSNLENCMRQLNHAYCISQDIQVLKDIVQVLENILAIASENLELQSIVFNKIDQLLQNAESGGVVDPALYLKWIKFARCCNDKEAELSIIESAYKRFPLDLNILISFCEFVADTDVPDEEKITTIVQTCLNNVKSNPTSYETFCDLLIQKFMSFRSQDLIDISTLLASQGISSRAAFKYIITHCGADYLLKNCLPASVTKYSSSFLTILLSFLVNVHSLSESGIKLLGHLETCANALFQNKDSALALIEIYLKSGDFDSSNRIFIKATQSLINPSEFMMGYEDLKSRLGF